MGKTKLWATIVIIIIIIISAVAISLQIPKGETIKIGAIIPLTGPASYPGEQAKIGISAAVEEINEMGGINGKKIEVIYEDSRTNPAEGVSAFNKLVDMDEVDLIVSALSSVSMAIAPLAGEKKVPVIGIMATVRGFVQNNYTFRYQPLTDLEIDPIIFIVDTYFPNSSRMGIIYLNDEFGKDVFELISGNLSEKIEIYGENYLVTEKDFRTYITKLTDKEVDIIYIVGFDSHIINIIKNLRELNFNGEIISASTASLPTARQSVDELGEGVYVAAPPIYCQQIPLSRDAIYLTERLNEKGIQLNHYNAISYDVIKLVAYAIKERNAAREDIKHRLESLDSYSGVFGDLIISSRGHEIAYRFYPGIINNGTIECLQ